MLDDTRDTCHQPNPFPTDSELYFRVATRPIGWLNEQTQQYTGIGEQVAIVRAYAGGGRWLANVGKNYKLIENRDLFPHVEQHMCKVIDPAYMRKVTTYEHQAFGGRDCYREYIFHDLVCPAHDSVAFRLIVGNSYGAKAVTLLSGAIDFFCTNGMVFGTSEKHARKHTSGLQLTGLDKWITDSVTSFAAHGKRLAEYDDTVIDLTREDGLFEHLVKKGLLSERRARETQAAMHTERNRRQGRDHRPSLWHLYSALTDWASHSEVRDTGNDHAANTRIERTKHADRVIRSAASFVKEGV